MGVPKFQATLGTDIAGLLELTLYGLKGAAAYADHALVLGYEDAGLYAQFHEALDFLAARRQARRPTSTPFWAGS